MPKEYQFVGGQLYYVDTAQYAANKGNLPTFDGTDQEAWRTAFDSEFTSNEFGALGEISITYKQENEQKIYSMNCTDNLFISSADQKATLAGVLLENIKRDTLATLLGAERQTVAASPTTVTAEPHGTGWTVGVPFRLNNKNAANTIVGSIVIKSGSTTLTNNTDYDTYVGDGSNGDLGYTYIVPLTSQSGAITAGYQYTPASSEFMTKQTINKVLPTTAYKFVSCPFQVEDDAITPWRRVTAYFTSCSLTGDLAIQFFKQGDTFTGIGFEVVSDGGIVMIEMKKGATQSDVL